MAAVSEHLTEHTLDEGTRAARELRSELANSHVIESVALLDRGAYLGDLDDRTVAGEDSGDSSRDGIMDRVIPGDDDADDAQRVVLL